ncbi:hypothetical protein SPRG_13179 [Saprolegnia parasitica CBS 223.65]|uniref:Clathrin light chain n=1 Tax=Saprolegnia parasitica (strain CBS 223.65) TaxID=695850 RepID=A0A067BY50_SAPPC|nr:hypothetical protein SPRG_13179 [Saprolegnia parasitica CBS 223.65]KDO21765.1 hypothetical protein SPRG_13179 [Saprolegnia parasitica CBS 223.65]|eukprot:XP_012207565.1 hypothetical protein SPRG_13179 [Saprolegnia parasitica CBS 223.65]
MDVFDVAPTHAAYAEFQAEYERKIQETALEHAKVAEENRAKAFEVMEQFKAERERLREAKILANRTQEQAAVEKLEADMVSPNPWERVVTLVELESIKAKHAKRAAAEARARGDKPEEKKHMDSEDVDVTRMKQIFLQLKQEPLDATRAFNAAA